MMNGQAPHPQQQEINLNQPASITLSLGAWNMVLGLIAEGPWKTADPLIQEMRKQLAPAIEAQAKPAQQPDVQGSAA